MTKAELSKALELAKTRTGIDFADTNLHKFNGFAMRDFKPLYVRLEDVADLIRYQCNEFGGGFDNDALNEIAEAGRTKFLVV